MVSGSWDKTDPLFQDQRAITHPFFVTGSNVPGAVGNDLLNLNLNSPSQNVPTGLAATAPSIAALVPGTYTLSNAAGIGRTYDLSQFQTLLLEQEGAAVTSSFTAHLTEDDSVVAFGDAEYFHGQSFTQFLPRVVAVTVPAGAPFNPTTGQVKGVQFGVPQAPKQ
jgi:iron complex outermembrane receptor protein